LPVRNGGQQCRAVATMRVWGPDRHGLVAISTELLHRYNCTILQSEHYTDTAQKMFFQRIVFDNHDHHPRRQQQQEQQGQHSNSNDDNVDLESSLHEMELSLEFQSFKKLYQLNGDLDYMRRSKRIAIFVSKFDHCLWELLLRHQAQELSRYCDCTFSLVISNHEQCRSIVEDTFHIPFVHIPKTCETKALQEQREMDLCQQYNIDFIILARYMQVLSPQFLNERYPIINIHHSFLPAFLGGRAYHQAHERGVKLIGATVRY
jgi:formyltetrahydrofolate deformylase